MSALHVIHTETGEVVQVIDVTGKSESAIDKCERGLLRNMNRDEYHVGRSDAARLAGKTDEVATNQGSDAA